MRTVSARENAATTRSHGRPHRLDVVEGTRHGARGGALPRGNMFSDSERSCVTHCFHAVLHVSPDIPLSDSLTCMDPAPQNLSDSEGLIEGELFWRDRYEWLCQSGYELRTRYRPDWVPSWRGTNKFFLSCEDGISLLVRLIYFTYVIAHVMLGH